MDPGAAEYIDPRANRGALNDPARSAREQSSPFFLPPRKNAGALQRNLKETQAHPATPRHGTTPRKCRRVTAHLHRNVGTPRHPTPRHNPKEMQAHHSASPQKRRHITAQPQGISATARHHTPRHNPKEMQAHHSATPQKRRRSTTQPQGNAGTAHQPMPQRNPKEM